MGIKKFAALCLLLGSVNASAANPLVNEGVSIRSRGRGNVSCSATCISTCGGGVNQGTLIASEPVRGYGDNAVQALNNGVLACHEVSSVSCGLGDQSTAVFNEFVKETRMGLRSTKEGNSKGLVVLSTTPMNAEDCAEQNR